MNKGMDRTPHPRPSPADGRGEASKSMLSDRDEGPQELVGSATVAVHVTRDGALDTMPGVAGRVLGLVPGLPGIALDTVPTHGQVVLGLIPGLAGVIPTGFP